MIGRKLGNDEARMDEKDVFRALLEAREKGLPVALATIIRTQGSMPRHAGSKMVVYPDGRIVGTVGGGAMEARVIQAAQQALLSGQTSLSSYRLNDLADGDPGVCGGTAEIFVEPILARPTMIVIGCGHTGKSLAELAKWLDFRVIVSDDRAEICNPTAIPNMDGYLVASSAEVAEKLPLGPHTYVAAVTRGMAVDLELFPALLAADLPYLGVIGSRRRWALTIKELEARGMTRNKLERVHAPIGLELNAETPQEIAVSIMAEIIMIRRGGTGVPMQWMGPAED
jgi:xanthine dehydrogenase accessory factor